MDIRYQVGSVFQDDSKRRQVEIDEPRKNQNGLLLAVIKSVPTGLCILLEVMGVCDSPRSYWEYVFPLGGRLSHPSAWRQ